MSAPILQYFTYRHLPYGAMQTVSAHCATLAQVIDQLIPDGPEKSAGLRKLLEAKDCFVRAALPEESDPDSPDNQDKGYTSGSGLFHYHGKAQHTHEGGNEPHRHVGGAVVSL